MRDAYDDWLKGLAADTKIHPHLAFHARDAEVEAAQSESRVLREQVSALTEENGKLREALKQAKVEYWNRAYEGSGKVKALSVQEFDAFVDAALTEPPTPDPTEPPPSFLWSFL